MADPVIRRNSTELLLSIKAQEQTAHRLQEHQETVSKLRLENLHLSRELELESRQARMTQSVTAKKVIQQVQDSGDSYVRKIEVERRRIKDLEEKIRNSYQQLIMLQNATGGQKATHLNLQSLNKHLRIMDNRYATALKRYNELLQENRQLRDQIDGRRRERVMFDAIYKRLEREVLNSKRDSAASNQSCEESRAKLHDIEMEMRQFKAHAEQQQADFDAEWKSLTRVMTDERDEYEQGKREHLFINDGSMRGEMTIEQEAELKKAIAESAWMMDKDRAVIQASQDAVAAYEDAFARIQEATGISGIDELVAKFAEAEDKSYSLFNYVNQLARDIETLEVQLGKTKDEMEKYRGQGVHSDSHRKRALRKLQTQLDASRAKASSYETKQSDAMGLLMTVKEHIQRLFLRMGCTTASAEGLWSQGAGDANLVQYLAILEQRLSEIQRSYTSTMGQDPADPVIQALRNQARVATLVTRESNRQLIVTPPPTDLVERSQPLVSRSASALNVKAPSWEDLSSDSGSEDEGARPLTLEKLHRTPVRFKSRSRHRRK